MSITQFRDITAYYDQSRADYERGEVKSLAQILDEETPDPIRWPVRNREPRTPISSQKRAIIHERDGGQCRYCYTHTGMLVVDHIIPRSAFPADQLHIADRSDNLHSACWDCNETRSNFESVHIKRLGVVARCFYCVHPEYDGDEPLPYEVRIPVFCGRCGVSRVPEVDGWVL